MKIGYHPPHPPPPWKNKHLFPFLIKDYFPLRLRSITTSFKHVHTSEACVIKKPSLLFTFSCCLHFKLNLSCVTLFWNRILLSHGFHLKQNFASSFDIIQFQGPHKPLHCTALESCGQACLDAGRCQCSKCRYKLFWIFFKGRVSLIFFILS